MRPLTAIWVGVAAVIAYGSTYPFDFHAPALDADALRDFLATCCEKPGRGDVLGNVVLFLPFGFFGIVGRDADRPLGTHLIPVLVGGTVFALALQLAQFFLPSRDQNLQDVLWNAIGIVAGALVAGPARHALRADHRVDGLEPVPALLIGSWLLYRLIPFVPSIDLQVIKDSLKPLLIRPQIDAVGVFHDAVAWMVVAALLRRAYRRSDLSAYLPLGILLVFVAEIGIVHNALSLSNVVGATLAIAAWWGVRRRIESGAGGLAALLCAVVVVQGLTPFVLRSAPDSFAWLPFKGLLGGSMYVNAQAICQKVFLYGSLVYLLWQTRIHRAVGILIGVSVVSVIEFAQVFVAGHTPEITDPALLILAAATIVALQAHSQGTAAARVVRPHRSRVKRAVSDPPAESDRPAKLTINLRRIHARYLERRAQQSGGDIAKVCGDILDAFAEEQTRHGSRLRLDSASAGIESADPDGDSWLHKQVALHPQRLQELERLSRDHGLSPSRLMRRIIARQMRTRSD